MIKGSLQETDRNNDIQVSIDFPNQIDLGGSRKRPRAVHARIKLANLAINELNF